jgi:hypothetical protein
LKKVINELLSIASAPKFDFLIILSLDSINERFYKIDQCFRYTSIDYFYPVVTSAFIDNEDEILKIKQIFCFERFSVINVDLV